uniref:Uncharacterized protein n=1 Tax=Oryza glaberrima TaxID=4538 RepID=I1R1I9_ORYGL
LSLSPLALSFSWPSGAAGAGWHGGAARRGEGRAAPGKEGEEGGGGGGGGGPRGRLDLGPSIPHCNKQTTGLVQRVVHELFQSLQSSESIAMWSVKLSMVNVPASCSEFEPTSLNLYSH